MTNDGRPLGNRWKPCSHRSGKIGKHFLPRKKWLMWVFFSFSFFHFPGRPSPSFYALWRTIRTVASQPTSLSLVRKPKHRRRRRRCYEMQQLQHERSGEASSSCFRSGRGRVKKSCAYPPSTDGEDEPNGHICVGELLGWLSTPWKHFSESGENGNFLWVNRDPCDGKASKFFGCVGANRKVMVTVQAHGKWFILVSLGVKVQCEGNQAVGI